MINEIKIEVDPKSLSIAAGVNSEIIATVRNNGNTVDQIVMGVEGIEPSWYTLPVASVALFPNDKDSLKIILHLPEQAKITADNHSFFLTFFSEEDPDKKNKVQIDLDVPSLPVKDTAGTNKDVQPAVKSPDANAGQPVEIKPVSPTSDKVSDHIRVTLTPGELKTYAGQMPVQTIVRIQNLGEIVDKFQVQVDGIDKSWYSGGIESVSLMPHESGEITITFQPPKVKGVRSGKYTFGVTVRSEANSQEYTTAPCKFEILPVPEFKLEIHPLRVSGRRKGSCRVALSNTGVTDINFTLSCTDIEEGCRFDHKTEKVKVAAWDNLEVPMEVRPKRSWLVGEKKRYDIVVTATTDTGFSQSMNGEFNQNPLFTSWKPILKFIRNVAVLAVVIFGLYFLLNFIRAFLTPSSPKNLKVTSSDTGFINLAWELPEKGTLLPFSKYKIYRGISSENVTYLDTAPDTVFKDTSVTGGTTYFYKVAGVNIIGDEGAKSDEATNKQQTKAAAPSSPQNLKVTGTGDGSISIAWEAPSGAGAPSVTEYKVYRGTMSGGETYLTTVPSTAFNDMGAASGKPYYYRVTAVTGAGETGNSNEVNATAQLDGKGAVPQPVVAAPSAPQNLRVMGIGNSNINIAWDPPAADGGSAITGYKIYRGTSAGGEVYLTTVTSATFSDTGAVSGTTYYYWVTAVNASGEAAKSNEVNATPQPAVTAPATPLNLRLNSAGGTNASISWDPPVNNGGSPITGYKIYRGASAGGEVYLTTVAGINFNDTSLVTGTTYYYKVSVTNAIGESTFSNEISATPQPTATAPSAPQTLMVQTISSTILSITWNAPADNGGSPITGYNVYRGNTTGTETLLTTVTTNSFTDNNAVSGTTYYYKVKAINANGEGSFSNEVSATLLTYTVASPPQNLRVVSSGSTYVNLAWDAPASNGGSAYQGYKVYRSTGITRPLLLTTVSGQTFNDTSVTSGTTYYYKVTVVNASGESGYSNEKSITPTSIQIIPPIYSPIVIPKFTPIVP